MNKNFIRAILVLPVVASLLSVSLGVTYADNVYDGNGILVWSKDSSGKTTYYNTPEWKTAASQSADSGCQSCASIKDSQANSGLYKDGKATTDAATDTTASVKVDDSANKVDDSVNKAEDAKLARQNDAASPAAASNETATAADAKNSADMAGSPDTAGKSSLMGTTFKFDPNTISPTSNPKGYHNGSGNIQPFLERIAQILLIVVSTGAVLSIVIGGFYMATSGGDTEKANKGKIIISYNIIAIVVALLSYSIIQFVIWLI